jgi:hypothetical protein
MKLFYLAAVSAIALAGQSCDSPVSPSVDITDNAPIDTVDTVTCIADEADDDGLKNDVNGDDNLIDGDQNRIKGHDNNFVGYKNDVKGCNNNL